MVKRKDVAAFFERCGIDHAERVEFTLHGYTVWSYKRRDNGEYVIERGLPVMETKFVQYEDAAAVSAW